MYYGVTTIEVANILESFDLDNIKTMIEDQVAYDENKSFQFSSTNNIFHPLYYEYINISESDEIPEEDKQILTDRYRSICKIFIDLISDKFDINILEELDDLNTERLTAITFALYYFFIMNLHQNLTYILYNYIITNYEKLYKIFVDSKNKKDSSTLFLKSFLPTEISIIVSNIYTICKWILTEDMNVEKYLSLTEDGNIYADTIKELYNDGVLNGDFNEAVLNLFNQDLAFQNSVVLELTSLIRRKYDIQKED